MSIKAVLHSRDPLTPLVVAAQLTRGAYRHRRATTGGVACPDRPTSCVHPAHEIVTCICTMKCYA